MINMKMKNIKWSFLLILGLLGISITSCVDEPNAYKIAGGTPTISYIRPVSVLSKDSLLVEAPMNSTICIVGNNLRSIVGIEFNDKPAVLNTSYMTDHTMIVTVPNTIPNKISDKIYLITSGNDTIPYDFKVVVPPPTITSLSNEFALPGEEVAIAGDYFLDYDNAPLTIQFGDKYVLDRSYIKEITKNRITFKVPQDAPYGKMSVTSNFGKTVAPFRFHDNRGMLFDFDHPCFTGTVLGNHGWHARTIQSDETSLSGNYLVLGNADLDDKTWNDGSFSFEYWAGNWGDPEAYADYPRLTEVGDFTDWENKSLKFELLIPSANPWSAAPMQIIFTGVDKVSTSGAGVKDIYGNTLAGANNTFFHSGDGWGRALYMPWKNTGSFDTQDKWMTVTIPMTEFNKYWDGNPAKKTFSSTADFASLTIFVCTGSENDKTAIPAGTKCHPIFKIDNIRIVPNK